MKETCKEKEITKCKKDTMEQEMVAPTSHDTGGSSGFTSKSDGTCSMSVNVFTFKKDLKAQNKNS